MAETKVSNQQSANSGGSTSIVNRVMFAAWFLGFVSCLLSVEAAAQRSRNPKSHNEDLTDNRLKFPVVEDSVFKLEDEPEIKVLPPDHAVTETVNSILDSIARFNKGRLFIDGYTIQIYSGLKREEAMNSIKKMKDEITNLTPDLAYQQPKFRVKTGSYFTRLEAQRDLRRLKQIFPTAILVPEKVALK